MESACCCRARVSRVFSLDALYPPVEPYDTGLLEVGEGILPGSRQCSWTAVRAVSPEAKLTPTGGTTTGDNRPCQASFELWSNAVCRWRCCPWDLKSSTGEPS